MTEITERTWLRGPLHARPAGLLVRLAATFDSVLHIRTCEREADARSMFDVMALGADEGDRIELRGSGPDSTRALVALRELIERNFDEGLVPESGRAVVRGLAIGRALRVTPREPRSAPALASDHETLRAHAALVRARADLAELMSNLDPEERSLFAPEADLLDAIEPRLFAAVALGQGAEDAALHATAGVAHDLMLDARARLLDALDGEGAHGAASDEDTDSEPRVVVVHALTPTLVARLSRRVVGLVVLAEDAHEAGAAALTSHAVILASGRGLPIAFVGRETGEAIAEGAWIIVDATGDHARVWTGPDGERIDAARKERERAESTRVALSMRAKESIRNFDFAVRANVNSLSEVIPEGADGVGLLRTELVFAGRSRAPSLTEQVNAFARVVTEARGGPVTVRLFDGGADKPLAWLPQPDGAGPLRGIGLLFTHPDVLHTQLRAIAALAGRAHLRVLVPMTVTADDIVRVRAIARPGTLVGAMIESVGAVDIASSIVAVADFISIGTNDLSASLSSSPREKGVSAPRADVFREVRRVVAAARVGKKPVTVCGELAAEEGAALALAGLGVDAVSVAPSRFLDVKLALLGATREDCARVAEAALA